MSKLVRRIRRPVKREGADDYLLYTLLSFGFSVGLTRLFLELTGYPQLGDSELHFAHVLWGGLLLFIAAVLPLVYANRWVYTAGAITAGIGVGLFIDEVGKFVTQTNDYFYPPAAPIIYAFFLVTVLVYLQIRKPPSKDTRAELYRALDAFEEVLDRDLDPGEREELEARLQHIIDNTSDRDQATLATHLLEFLKSDSLHVVPDTPNLLERASVSFQAFEDRWIRRVRVKGLLTGLLAALGIIAVYKLVQLLAGALDPPRLEALAAEMVAFGRIASEAGLSWFLARLALEGAVGIILLIAAILLLLSRDRMGVKIGFVGLLLSLTTVNLLVFYYDQFATILSASIQFITLLILIYYRRRFIRRPEAAPLIQATHAEGTG